MRIAWGIAAVFFVALGSTSRDVRASTRVAVLVGANEAAPGRRALRYSHRDVERVARVLIELGGFEKDNVVTLLDPRPEAVLNALDQNRQRLAAGDGDSMLFFYYSGHADASHLYPGGHPLSMKNVRERIERRGPSLRIGFVDACRGGGWTAVKGLRPVEAFDVELPVDPETAGSALIASSSGLEDAHESERLGGSFFTHHWVAALRGAGDRDGDARVTLTESFEYAKAMTIRDTSLVADEPQRPSFQLNLKGRRDVELASISSDHSVIRLEQERGPLQLISLSNGQVVLEVPEGRRSIMLAVPPGKYVMRRRVDGETRARELWVRAEETTRIREAGLELQSTPIVRDKSPTLPLTENTTPLGGTYQVSFGVGRVVTQRPNEDVNSINESEFGRSVWYQLGLHWGITDRLMLNGFFPGLAYRFGEPGGVEFVPYAAWGGSSRLEDGRSWGIRSGLDTRVWFSPRGSVNFGVGASPWTGAGEGLDALFFDAQLGLSYTFGSVFSVHPTVSLDSTFSRNEELVSDSNRISIGSGGSFGLRQMPLIRYHASELLAIDLYVGLQFDLDDGTVDESLVGAVTFAW